MIYEWNGLKFEVEFDLYDDEPDVGFLGGAYIQSVKLNGVDVYMILDESFLKQIEAYCND